MGLEDDDGEPPPPPPPGSPPPPPPPPEEVAQQVPPLPLSLPLSPFEQEMQKVSQAEAKRLAIPPPPPPPPHFSSNETLMTRYDELPPLPPPPPPPPPWSQQEEGEEEQQEHVEASKPLPPPLPPPWYPRPLAMARGHFLYLYQPYDKSLWSKLHSPAHLLAMLVAAWPGWGVRACFFSLTLLCLLPELDEYQLLQFVQALKGSQFLAGIMLCMQGLGVFFLCAVVSPQASCRTAAPGVGKSIPLSVLSLLVTQALCWTAIGLLPRAKRTGKLSLTGEKNKRSKAARSAAAAATAAGNARGVAARVAAAAGQELRKRKPKGRGAAAAHAYAPLDEEAPPDQHELLSTISVPPDLVRAQHGDDEGDEGDEGDTHQEVVSSSGCCGTHNYKGNRMLRLMAWDVKAFVSCALLFGLMLLLVAAAAAADGARVVAEAVAEAARNEAFVALDGRADGLIPSQMATNGTDTNVEGLTLSVLVAGVSILYTEGSEAWRVDEWQLAVAFFLARILFALSALPFLLFEVPLLRTLLSHTSATGYSRNGGVVAKDDEGLQAYTDWLQRELRARRTAAHLSPAALQALTLAAEQAQAYLGALPDEHLHKRSTERVKTDLEAQLLRHVPRGHELYPRLFPEQLLCDEYLESSPLKK